MPLLALGSMLLFSCKKESKTPELSNLTATKNIVAALGFNINTVSFDKTAAYSSIKPLRFNTLAEAQLFFKRQQPGLIQITLDTLLSKKIKHANKMPTDDEDPVDFTDWQDHIVTMKKYLIFNNHYVTMGWTTGGNTSGGGGFSATNITSGIGGLTLGMSWQQTGYTYVNYPNSALIYFTVTGVQSYNVLVDGFLTFWTENYTLYGIYNTNTGAWDLDVTTN